MKNLIKMFISITYQQVSLTDEENIPMKLLVVTAGNNLSLTCPGVNEHSLIDTLSWKRSQQTIIKFVNGAPMVQNQRVSGALRLFGKEFQ